MASQQSNTTQSSLTSQSGYPRAGFRRRFGSWVYDALVAIAVYMCAGAVSFGIFGALYSAGIIDSQGFSHPIDLQQNSLLWSLIIYVWNLSWVSFFFVYFWARSGQTIGMRAWRLKVQNQDGSLISKTTGIKRLIFTLFGLGNLLVIVDRHNKLSLQDRYTDTEVVVLPTVK
ncbi:RDD family protein [Thalassotalea litorea]|uniref:RDD family protein n=1 Tax=Thalassotalea litorea TaxID=2020715 RepID=A0A5R9ITB7_9GAMM|nr:RDD family protein [Thalassotalea litorea]TLU67337.1 RDD family protein [Thalassotalea litorea]